MYGFWNVWINRRCVTYCIGYWRIRGFTKNSLAHYAEKIPQTCRMLRNAHVVLFHDDDAVLGFFRDHAAQEGINLVDRRVAIEALPMARHAGRFVACCAAMQLDRGPRPSNFAKEKGVTHYWRDYKDSGEDVYRAVQTIWMSKVGLVTGLAQKDNPFGHRHFAWVDASIGRFRGRRSNWRFMRIAPSADRLAHYGNVMRVNGSLLPINASFLLGGAEAWAAVNDAFADCLEVALNEPYCHDEETVLARVHQRAPELFRKIGDPIANPNGARRRRL